MRNQSGKPIKLRDIQDGPEPCLPPPSNDSGLNALVTIAALHGVAADIETLRHQFAVEGAFDTRTIILAARSLHIHTKIVRPQEARLHKMPFPAVAVDKQGRYFIVGKALMDQESGETVSGSEPPNFLIQHANQPPEVMSHLTFLSAWTGELILFTSKASFAGAAAKFDFTWFIPAVVKYRKFFGEVLFISLTLQIIALTTPLFFQVVMDKVLVNHAMKTLNVIAIGLIIATVFDVLLSFVRTYIFARTSSKIDVELGARLFKHLLSLPIAYFESRRIGDSVARVRELENIRSFLTGNAMTLVLDIAFSFIFMSVMLWYSPMLTLVVIASIPLYFGLSLIFTPILRTRLNEKFNRSSESQSFLVETIGGIGTVKSMAVEPRWQLHWEKQLAAYVSAGLSATNISTIAGSGITLVSKLVTAGIMWLGASEVMGGKMSVGELVAFNMLAGQISSPILRLAQLWNDFQQIGISMSRLGDILNARAEVTLHRVKIPKIKGDIEFDRMHFRYRPDAPDVIRGVSLKINAGEVVGIVGRSGSGKSTLSKLVQRLYVPERGRVLIDGLDIGIVDIASLRHQVGVVLQENVLFNRSIRDNIALNDPAWPIEKVIEAAKLAGAHDFICDLPNGYDTSLGENGTGISGGQRQRIAIARALIADPRILIFDEATSALDYESEKIVQDNMRRISHGRTVLIIAHRLSAVRDADKIIVLEKGEVAAMGSHAELCEDSDGIYAHLLRLQHGSQPSLAQGGE